MVRFTITSITPEEASTDGRTGTLGNVYMSDDTVFRPFPEWANSNKLNYSRNSGGVFIDISSMKPRLAPE